MQKNGDGRRPELNNRTRLGGNCVYPIFDFLYEIIFRCFHSGRRLLLTVTGVGGQWTALVSDLVLELVGAVVAGAGGGELEALDGEGEVLVIGVVDEEAVVDGLLQALGLVALGHERAGGAGGLAVLDAGGLAEGLVVGLDVVDHDPPLAVHVDGAPRLDVLDVGGAEVRLLGDVPQAVHRVLRVGQHVLVQLLHGVVVVLDGLLDLVGRVLGVLQAVRLGVAVGCTGWTGWRGEAWRGA